MRRTDGVGAESALVPNVDADGTIQTKLLAVTQWLLRYLLATARSGRSWSDLTYQQYNAMRVIALAGKSSQTEIARRLMVTAPAVTRLVAALVDEGLVRRHGDPRDGRAVLLTLTPRGRRRVTTMRRDLVAAADRLLLPLDEEERRELQRVLDRLQRLRSDLM